jgi:hypothetical protein
MHEMEALYKSDHPPASLTRLLPWRKLRRKSLHNKMEEQNDCTPRIYQSSINGGGGCRIRGCNT